MTRTFTIYIPTRTASVGYKGAPMLKLYVDAMIRLNHSTQSLSQRIKQRHDESGFVSAETIALAVAGVLIVGGVFIVFKERIGTAVGKMFDSVDSGFTDTKK